MKKKWRFLGVFYQTIILFFPCYLIKIYSLDLWRLKLKIIFWPKKPHRQFTAHRGIREENGLKLG